MSDLGPYATYQAAVYSLVGHNRFWSLERSRCLEADTINGYLKGVIPAQVAENFERIFGSVANAPK